MNKSVMIPIQPKWSKMIKDGLKDLEFRNYVIPKGTKVYLYESLGKRKTGYCLGNCEECPSASWGCDGWEQDEPSVNGCERDLIPYHPDIENLYEGQGKVVAEFVVGEVKYLQKDYTLDTVNFFTTQFNEIFKVKPYAKPQKTLEEQGYTNQKFAMEITDLIVYDEEWQSEQLSNLDYDFTEEASIITKIINAPTEPLDISEFVGWNKLEKYPMGECGTKFSDCYKCDMDNECSIQIDAREECKLQFSPQGKVYVVEREN